MLSKLKTPYPLQDSDLNKPNFTVCITECHQLNQIEGAWSLKDFLALLDAMECTPDDPESFGDVHDLCVMSLQDRPKEDAAEIVLRHRLSGKLTAGQIKNAAIELADEKLWEQFADLSLHEELFHVGSLMYEAFPSDYFEADALKLTIEITAKNESAKDLLESDLHESLLVRLLADGMESDAILHRLFDDQLAGKSFPEASSIVWIINPITNSAGSAVIEVISSAHWFDALKGVETFQSHAEPDACENGD